MLYRSRAIAYVDGTVESAKQPATELEEILFRHVIVQHAARSGISCGRACLKWKVWDLHLSVVQINILRTSSKETWSSLRRS